MNAQSRGFPKFHRGMAFSRPLATKTIISTQSSVSCENGLKFGLPGDLKKMNVQSQGFPRVIAEWPFKTILPLELLWTQSYVSKEIGLKLGLTVDLNKECAENSLCQ